MTVFKIGFLLAFQPLYETIGTRGKAERKKKSRKDSKSRKSITSKSSKQSKRKSTGRRGSIRSRNRSIKDAVIPPKYVLDVGNPIGCAHIEYELIPEIGQKQQIDVVCWKGVAKVFTEEDALTYRVRMTEGRIWVPIFLETHASQMSTEQLEQFHQHQIYFRIFTNKKNLGIRAKAEKAKLFYLKEEDVSSTSLAVSAYTENPNFDPGRIPSSTTIKFLRNLIADCLYTARDDELVTRLRMSEKVQNARMIRIIEKISNNEEVFCKEFIPIAQVPKEASNVESKKEKLPKPKKKKEKKEKGKKKKKKANEKGDKKKKSEKASSKVKKLDVLQIKVSGEVFFTDPIISIYDSKESNDVLLNAYVFLSVDRLLTKNQKFYMNPMVVKIHKIENLDVEALKQKKFKAIFVRYCIPNLAEVKTLTRDVAEKIRFSEAHAFFTHDLSRLSITEFLQNNRLFLEVCGIREPNIAPQIRPRMFGTEHADKYLGRRITSTEYIISQQNKLNEQYTPIEVLAVVAYDLSSLLKPIWNYTCNERCHNPDNLFYQQRKPFKLHLERVTPNSINIKEIFRTKSNSPLSELSLLENGTSLKVEVYFLAPATDISNAIYYRFNCFNRMLLIIYSTNVAVNLLNELLEHNHRPITKSILVPDLNKVEDSFFHEDTDQYVSGFVIDDGTTYAFFVESVYQCKLFEIWKRFALSPSDEATVFFDSSSVFQERLYTAFADLRGLCVITLQKPLRDILAQEAFYVEGNVPLPCWQAVKKLDALFRATTLKDILQYNLLPTPEELLSLNMEWGVPMRWRHCQGDVISQRSVLP